MLCLQRQAQKAGFSQAGKSWRSLDKAARIIQLATLLSVPFSTSHLSVDAREISMLGKNFKLSHIEGSSRNVQQYQQLSSKEENYFSAFEQMVGELDYKLVLNSVGRLGLILNQELMEPFKGGYSPFEKNLWQSLYLFLP